MRLTEDTIVEIIANHPSETAWIDYKQKYYERGKGADLIHDLLSMANFIRPGPRYIIFGVADDGEIVGLDEGVRVENIQSVLSAINITNMPEFAVYDVNIDGLLVSVWQIEDVPYKPFFLTRDYEKQGKRIRAGVIYSRSGPTNTPIDGAAREAEVAEMWRERFRLTQPPRDKAEIIIKSVHRWLKTPVIEGDDPLVWYNFDFPEYTVELRYRSYENFYEPWMERKNLKSRPRDFGGWSYRVNYFSTTLISGVFFSPRHTMMPFPKVKSQDEYRKENIDMEYVLKADDRDFFVGAICSWEASSLDLDETALSRMQSYSDKVREDVMVMFGLDVFEIDRPV